MLWLALHFPNLALEIYDRADGQRQQFPLVILDNNRVCHRNAAAADAGIEFGTTLATAHSICIQLLHQHKDSNAEQNRLRELANQLYRYSSYVSVQYPDCVLIEVAGSLSLFGAHTKLTDRAQALCQSLGHSTQAGVARTPWAAIALARSGAEQLHQVSLSEAGLELAGIPTNVIERFDNMGIYTLGPLLALPSKQLGRRFGKILLTYLGQLTGTLPDPRMAIVPAKDFKETLHLPQPISNKQDLYAQSQSPMQQLAQALQQWLITHQYGCERVAWRFLSHKSHAEVVIRFAQAKQNAVDILRISELKLESEGLPAEVLSIELHSLRLRRWHNRSQNLFNFHTGDQLENEGLNSQAYELISEVNARLGDHVCRGIDVLDQHSPESAWCHTALTALHRSSATSQSPSTPARPLWLFDPPRQIPRSDLVLLHGPERIQRSWWQTEATFRDYYIARHHQGSECWVYREHQGQGESLEPSLKNNIQEKWYLHGYFG